MEIDSELQNLIDEYIKQVESKGDDLAGLKRNIDGIISVSKREVESAKIDLEKDFDANKISEEEYLTKFRGEKENILKTTEEKLSSLIAKYKKVYNT